MQETIHYAAIFAIVLCHLIVTPLNTGNNNHVNNGLHTCIKADLREESLAYSVFEKLCLARTSRLQEIEILGIRVKMNFVR